MERSVYCTTIEKYAPHVCVGGGGCLELRGNWTFIRVQITEITMTGDDGLAEFACSRALRVIGRRINYHHNRSIVAIEGGKPRIAVVLSVWKTVYRLSQKIFKSAVPTFCKWFARDFATSAILKRASRPFTNFHMAYCVCGGGGEGGADFR